MGNHIGRLAYKPSSIFFYEREEREVDFCCCCCFLRQKVAREGPTTGTGNEKRRTLRKSAISDKKENCLETGNIYKKRN